MEHIRSIWNSPKDLSEALGVPYTTAYSWYQRGGVPARYDVALVSAAKSRGHTLTFEQLAGDRARRAAS